jgi:glycosyltransferase involved in cell wall biosynthesis
MASEASPWRAIKYLRDGFAALLLAMTNQSAVPEMPYLINVLHITPTYYPATYWGGPIFSVYGLNNALARLPGVSLKVLTTDAAGPGVAERVDVQNLDDGLFVNQEVLFTRRVAGAEVSFELLFRLPSLIRWADVVHLTATYSFPTIPTLFLCRVLDKPVVWSPRGAIQEAYEWAGAPRKRLKRAWERLCNALIRPGRAVAHVTSERERVATQARIPRAKAVIVPNGVDVPDSLPDRVWQPDGRLRLMYLGRISPKKGIENLLHAMCQLVDSDISLRIYGTGPSDYVASIKHLAARLGLRNPMVEFAGHVDGEDKTEAFRTTDVCVVPSFSENFCMVVPEALAHGVPVIASQGTPWRQIEDKHCGLWVDNSPASLVQAILQIRSAPLAEMGRRGREWVEAEYSWESIAGKMVDVYRELVSVGAGLHEQ